MDKVIYFNDSGNNQFKIYFEINNIIHHIINNEISQFRKKKHGIGGTFKRGLLAKSDDAFKVKKLFDW